MNQYLTHACGGCKPKKPKGKKAFTLIELLIVITIIGILAVALLPRIIGAPARARDVARKADLSELSIALEAYMSDNGQYPASEVGECLGATGGVDLTSYFDNDQVPTDPLSTNAYKVGTSATACSDTTNAGRYYYQSLTRNGVPGSAYLLLAKLELPCVAQKTPGCADASKVIQTAGTEITVEDMNTAVFASSITAGSEAYALVK